MLLISDPEVLAKKHAQIVGIFGSGNEARTNLTAICPVGALIYAECKNKGLGRDLPSEWFGAELSEWMDKGFMPSP